MRQPGMFAWQVFDAKATPLLRSEYRIRRVTKAEANTLEELAGKLVGVDAQMFLRTVRAYNDSCGSFESNPEMRARYLGPNWELAKSRGTRFNMGAGLRMALDIGARPYGNWSGCHSVA